MKNIQLGDVVGDYTVIDIAGSGGMGAVYKIEHLITKRVEAMKLLPAGLSGDPEQVRRFEREIQLQARLHHPNIVALYNAVRDADSIALVMEFVEGESLQCKIDAGPLPVETAVDFSIQVLGALAYAHEADVIHRDVSPNNIIITPDRVAKLTDFGLALGATDLRLSTSGVPLGSPWYMSPEQVKGIRELDARTDVYAMGAVLHEMLTGRKLFEAEGAFAVMRAHVEAEPRIPSSLNPKVPPLLDGIVSRAVAKDPAMRFGSADEFRLALQRFALDYWTMPKPSSPWKTWDAAFPRMVRASREAMLAVLAATMLAAVFCAVRFSPSAVPAPFKEGNSGAAAISQPDANESLSAVTTRIEPETPEAAASAPAEVPVATVESTTTTLPRVPSPAKAVQRTSQTEQDTRIRVSGGESHPVAALPTPRRDPPQAVESPEPAVPRATSVEAPEAGKPPTAATPSERPTTPREAEPANPQSTGNRFVRALGKVNPFRRRVKQVATEAPPKQN